MGFLCRSRRFQRALRRLATRTNTRPPRLALLCKLWRNDERTIWVDGSAAVSWGLFGGGVRADTAAWGFVWDGGPGANGWWECVGARGGDGCSCNAEDFAGDD